MKQILSRELLNEKIWSNTYTAMKCLIDNSYYAQLTFPPKFNSNISYLKEYCTAKMCTARRSGHTTAMCLIAKEYFDKVVFLGPTYDMSENIAQCFRRLQNDNTEFIRETKNELTTKSGYYLFGSQNSLEVFKGKEIEAVFIDGTFFMTSKKEDEIYQALSPCMCKYPQRFFIFIQ